MRRLLVAAAVVAALAAHGAQPAGLASAGRSTPLRVGLVAAFNGSQDPFRDDVLKGLRQAVRRLGIVASVRTPTPREGYVASFTAFAAQRYDLVVGVGPLVYPQVKRVARKFPGVHFASLDVPRASFGTPPPNLSGIVVRREEAGYLAGYLAGLVERRRPGRDVVSAVGGAPYPGVDTYIAGYRAGARRAAPGIAAPYAYSNSFSAPEACAAIASTQIAKGSHVLFDVAGGCGVSVLRAARRHRIWAVGVDFDQSSAGAADPDERRPARRRRPLRGDSRAPTRSVPRRRRSRVWSP
jgi:basic membrane protein A